MELFILYNVSDSAFCKLIKTERRFLSKFLKELSRFYTFYRGSPVFDGALVLSKIDKSVVKTGGLASGFKKSSDNDKL